MGELKDSFMDRRRAQLEADRRPSRTQVINSVLDWAYGRTTTIDSSPDQTTSTANAPETAKVTLYRTQEERQAARDPNMPPSTPWDAGV